jgi:hypothetical protein
MNPVEKGFSERNLKCMVQFFRAFPTFSAKMPQAAALLHAHVNQDDAIRPQAAPQLNSTASQVPFFRHASGHSLVPRRYLDRKSQRPAHAPLVSPTNRGGRDEILPVTTTGDMRKKQDLVLFCRSQVCQKSRMDSGFFVVPMASQSLFS